MDSWIGQTLLQRYRVDARLGGGGMASVYLAVDENLAGRPVVVKHPLRETERDGSGLTDAELRDRFQREIAGLIRLDEVPGIVPILAQGVHEGTPFYVMRYMSGGSLDTRLERGPQAPGEVWAWSAVVARTLDRLHAQHPPVVHRDVKPANLLFDGDGAVHLADFGIVKELHAAWATTGVNTGIGTPGYMAPEQLLPDGEVDGRTDQYALAATMYQALTGQPPRYETRGSRPTGTGSPKRLVPPRELAAHLPESSSRVLERGLAKAQAGRFPSCTALVEAFGAGIERAEARQTRGREPEPGATVRAAPAGRRTTAPPGPPGPGRRPRRRGLVVGASLAALGLAAAAFFATRPSGSTPGPERGPVVAGAPAAAPAAGKTPVGGKTPAVPAVPTAAPQAPAPTAAPAAGGDVVAALRAELRASPPASAADFRRAIGRLQQAGAPAADLLREIYAAFVATEAGADDAEARAALGFARFDFEVPEIATNVAAYPFLRAVEALGAKRWLRGAEELRLAAAAQKEAEAHAARLLDDRLYVAMDMVLASFRRDGRLDGLTITPRFAAPYLVGYVTAKGTSEYEPLLSGAADDATASAVAAEAAVRRARAQVVLGAHERLLTAFHAAFLARFREASRLEDLSSAYGGRPDYPVAVRSFANGYVLPVLVFEDRALFEARLGAALGGPGAPTPAGGIFEPSSGLLLLYDDPADDADPLSWAGRRLHEATHQLQSAFGRQRNRWGVEKAPTGWLAEGLAEYFGGVALTLGGGFQVTGLNGSRLRRAQEVAAGRRAETAPYPVADVLAMAGWSRPGDLLPYAETRGLTPFLALEVFGYEQPWMFVHMCLDGADGRYRDRLGVYLSSVLERDPGTDAFRRAFALKSDADVRALQAEFEAHVAELLAKKLPAAAAPGR